MMMIKRAIATPCTLCAQGGMYLTFLKLPTVCLPGNAIIERFKNAKKLSSMFSNEIMNKSEE